MNYITEWIDANLGLDLSIQNKLLETLLTILLIWLLRKFIMKLVYKRVEDVRQHYRWRKTSAYIAFGLGLILISRVWFEGLKTMITYLGILSAGLAIALKDPITNLAGWVFIMLRRPFEVGDRIQINGCAGDVIDLSLFQFTLLEIANRIDAEQSTGRLMLIPNGKIFTEVQANYTKGFKFIWNEIPVMITFESNWKKAKEIFEKILGKRVEHLTKTAEGKIKRAAEKYMIFYKELTPIVYSSVKESGVLLTLRYICDPRQRRNSEQKIWEDILVELADCPDIDFAYPTQRFYDNNAEGKEGLKAAAQRASM